MHARAGAWQLRDGVDMRWSEGDNWVADVQLPGSCVYEYKYVLLDGASGQALSWQRGNNSVLALRAGEDRVEVCGRMPAALSPPGPPTPPWAMPCSSSRAALGATHVCGVAQTCVLVLRGSAGTKRLHSGFLLRLSRVHPYLISSASS
jgi:hypothetical protein